MRESNVTERDAVRRYNWLVRKDKEIPVRTELTELVPIPHQASSHRRSSAYDVLLHVSSGTPLISLPASGARCTKWRDAAWIHHLEVGKAVRRKSDGSSARPHKEGMPSAAVARPHHLVLRTPQPGRSPVQIPLEPGLYSKGISRQH